MSASTVHPLNCSATGIQIFLDHLASNGSSNETLRAYRGDLQGFLDWADATQLRVPIAWDMLAVSMANYLTEHRALWSARTVQRRLVAFRSWGAFAGAPRSFLGAYRAPVAERPQPHPIPEGVAGVLAMIRATDNPRHRALLALTGLMGLRVSEAVAVRPAHIDIVEMMLTVRGKGDKTRVIPISDSVWKHLKFADDIARARGTTLVDRTEAGARRAISRFGMKAGMSRHVKSHDMRATLATALFDKTHDIRLVQEVLGHANPNTTQVYVAVTVDNMRAAMEL